MTILIVLVLIVALIFDLIIIPNILIAVLGAFGVHISFCIALGIVVLINALFARVKSSNDK